MLEIKDLNVFYGEFQALFNVSLSISEGETVITVGPNGAGKSTLLKTISGLLHPRSGSITFLGKRIERLPAHEIVEYGIAHVPEGGRLFPRLTVLENLKVGSYLKKSRNDFHSKVKEIYQLFPILDERKRQLADTLSGGERQMLAIARCLMSKPKLILLDEPSSGLAPRIVSRVFEFIHRIKSQGYAILMVEQNVRKALQLSDRAYLMESGHMVKEGTKQNFLEDPYIKKVYIGL
ncbi:MAG: ABC transporter ATP-binding protein [Thermodesulfobacteriota bacterium]